MVPILMTFQGSPIQDFILSRKKNSASKVANLVIVDILKYLY